MTHPPTPTAAQLALDDLEHHIQDNTPIDYDNCEFIRNTLQKLIEGEKYTTINGVKVLKEDIVDNGNGIVGVK